MAENTLAPKGTIADARERFLKLAEAAKRGEVPARMVSPALKGLAARV